MHLRIASSRPGLVLISAIAALAILATGADAGYGHGHKKKKHRRYSHDVRYEQRWREPRHVVVSRPVRVVRAQPVYAACPPRYVAYRSPRVVVVRPAPYVRVGARIGSVNIGAIFGPRRQYRDYEYGCNFCEARFASFNSYDSHVHSCDHRPRNVHIQAEVWDEGGYREWCDHDRVYGRGEYDDDDYDDRYEEDWR